MPYRPSPKIADAIIAERHQIRSVVANAVDTSFQTAFHALGGKAGEVEKVIYFFMEGLPIIESGLNRLLKPYRVSVVVSGIFCHQTPKVKSLTPHISSASCELGDLALVATYDQIPAPDGLGNALLLQAKERFNSGVSPDQELLYETTDRFEYVSPRSLSSPTPPSLPQRSLVGALSCLYYWDLSPSYLWSYPLPAAYSTTAILARPRPLNSYFRSQFEDVVTDLFCGIAGRGFQKAPVGDGWSSIIHDLVKNSALRAVTHKKVFAAHGSPLPSRLYNYVSALREFGADTMVKCSLSGFLHQFNDNELGTAGNTLEEEARKFNWRDGEPRSQDQRAGSELPPLNRGNNSESGSGGGSFVVFQFKSNA